MNVFISYAHDDTDVFGRLKSHLAGMERAGIIQTWHDRCIVAGEDWAGKIDKHLNAADIILLLISPAFLSSNYCYDIELKTAMARHESGEAVVIPIIARPVLWEYSPFAKLQALPTDAKPISEWRNRDTALKNVAEGIERAIRGFRANP